jgi:hypothetical protein
MDRLAQLVDDWQAAIEGRKTWDMPACLEPILDAPLEAESVIEFYRLSLKAIRATELAGLPVLATRLKEVRIR